MRKRTKVSDKEILNWLESNYLKPSQTRYEVAGPRLYPNFPTDNRPGIRVYDGPTGTGHEDEIGHGKTLREAITNTILHPYGRQ